MRTLLGNRKVTVSYKIKCISFRIQRPPGAPDPRILNTPKAVAAIARDLIPDDGREHFMIILLDSALQVIGYHEVGVGSTDRVVSMGRDIFGAAIRVPGCVGIFAIHNHPSGDVQPSRNDLVLTRALVRASSLLTYASTIT